MRIIFMVLTVMLFGSNLAHAQETWTFKTEKDNIRVYSNTASTAKVKPIKVECTFNATAAQLAAVLLDIKNYGDWAYHTKSTMLVKQVSPTELYYYSVIAMPWPTENRDFAAHITVIQDPDTKVVTVDAPSVTGLVAEKAGLSRVPRSSGKWVITPVGSNQVKVSYYLELEPGGAAPGWLINTFIADGPLQTFKNLRLQLQKPAYKNAVLPIAGAKN